MTEPDEAVWADLAARRWRRQKWRRTTGEPHTEACAAYGTPIHRDGTYYLRPAYTDGRLWLSQRAYEEVARRQAAGRPSRRYSRPPDEGGAAGSPQGPA